MYGSIARKSQGQAKRRGRVKSLFAVILALAACTAQPALTTPDLPAPISSTESPPADQSPLGAGTHPATPESTATGWQEPPPGTVVIDTWLRGGAPFLPGHSTFLNDLVMPAIYAELVRVDANGHYFAYLARDLPTLDNGQIRFAGSGQDEYLEVEFRLRENALWQDGQPVTAADLVFSWELVMNPAWPYAHRGGAGGLAPEVYVTSAEALATDRIVYRFMSQRQAREAASTGGRLDDPTLYASLAGQIGPVVPLDYLEVGRHVLPRHLLESVPVAEVEQSAFASQPVYAGAYRLIEGGADGQPVVLEAFQDFALGAPAVPRVVFGSTYYSAAADSYWTSPDRLALALLEGAVHAQLALPGVRSREGEDPLAYDALGTTVWVSRGGWEVLDFNLDNPHLADLRVRQAIAHALDRQALIDEALAGHGTLIRSYLAPWHPLYAGDDVLPEYVHDLDQARALLQEAGYDLSQMPAHHAQRGPLVLQLASMDVTAYSRQGLAALIRQQLAAVGIQVEVSFYDRVEFEGSDCSGIRNGRHFDLGLAGLLDIPRDPSRWIESSTASWNIPAPENGCPLAKANWSGWRNGRVDEIMVDLKDGYLALTQPDAYQALWAEHQRLWGSDLPSLPLFDWQRPVVISPALDGLEVSPFAFGRGADDTWNIFEWVFAP